MDNDYTPIWEIYGLRSDPFSTNPILVKGGIIDPKSFVGRSEELKRLEKLFRSSGGSRSMVYGVQGVGKTTLVNYARIKALANNYFTPFHEIRADADWTADDFIYNTISAIYSTLIKFKEPGDKISKLIEDLKPVCDAYETTDRSIGISTPLLGGSTGLSRTINRPEINTVFLSNLFEKTVQTLIKSGFREVILHYNNLDNFDEEEAKLKKMFNKIRDFMQISQVHFVFIGSPTTASVISSIKRVSSIMSDTPIHVNALSLEEIKKILHARIDSCAIEGFNYFSPINDKSIELLYELHNGNIRAILNSLSTAVREITEEKPVLLTPDVLKKVLYKIAERRFASKTTPAIRGVLLEVLKQKECTNKSIAKSLNKRPQNISKYLADLKEIQCVYVSRTEGQKRYYTIAEWVKWLMMDPSSQTRLNQY